MSVELFQWDEMDQKRRDLFKISCEQSFPFFIRGFFQLLQGQKMLWNWHHAMFCGLAEEIYRGNHKRVIVNCPPGATKTEIWSIHWPAWCIVQCINSGLPSRWLPISYSDDLVTENTGRVKDIIDSEPYQAMWPLELSQTTRGKSDWKYHDQNGKEHRMFGTSLMGQVTGRRAGYMIDGAFTGALVLDDPLPPRDEGGKRMAKSNQSLNRVVRSRLAHDGVPIVMIQQRIGNGDSTDFMMGDKSPDTYTKYVVPAVIDRVYVDNLPQNIKDRVMTDTAFDDKETSYWPAKEPTETLMSYKKSDPFLYSSQYQQAPDEAMLEGVIWRKEIERMVEEGRVCRIPIEPALPVYTYWDLGINDNMAIWLMQPFRLDLRLAAFYCNNGHGMEHYINWLHDFRDKYKIRYEKHVAPHDIEVDDLMSGKSRKDTAHEMGIDFETVPRVKIKRDSIEVTRKLFPRLWIDPERCDVDPIYGAKVRGWEAIRKYRREYDEDRQVFSDKPYHDWTSNPADALQQLGLSWEDKNPNPHDHAKQFSTHW
ncbi:MAG: hypothetical protein HGB17_00135 [Syntrophobacteraceae bacterium]|nr:hypothetical protein [Syntrophobacteraceae bacterium]